MYKIYTIDGALITKTEKVFYVNYNYQLKCFYLVDEPEARAILIHLGEKTLEVNLDGREPYPWITTTVRVVKY